MYNTRFHENWFFLNQRVIFFIPQTGKVKTRFHTYISDQHQEKETWFYYESSEFLHFTWISFAMSHEQ